MHDSMAIKLDKLKNRLSEIETLLIDSETVKDIEKYTLLNKEFADLRPIVDKFQEYNEVSGLIKDANDILESDDEEMKTLAEDELKEISGQPELLEQELKVMLLPKDSADDGSAFLEIRAGAGGDEFYQHGGGRDRVRATVSQSGDECDPRCESDVFRYEADPADHPRVAR